MGVLKKVGVSALLVVSLLIGGLGLYWQYFIQTTIHVPASGLLYYIKSGSSLRNVAKGLKKKQVIKSAWMFEVLARAKFNNIEQEIKVGEYKLTSNMTPGQVLQLFHSGKIYQRVFVIKEGETSAQLLKHLQNVKNLKHQLFYNDQIKILQQLQLKQYLSLEGLFLPETYHYDRSISDLKLLIRAHSALMRYLNKEWAARDLKVPYENEYAALIMASIIEKEAAFMLDRKKVSSVLANRLMLRMKLQADPTVIFSLKGNYNGKITKTQLKINSPYNTYLHYGLPPTPIAMVSLSALHATLHPQWGKALYFVADGKGRHVFSDSLQGHNQAITKHLRNKEEDKNQ